jgi:hypothetical protein
LYRGSGAVEEDVFGVIGEITTGWFAFLDAAWLHFVERLAKDGILLTMSADELEKTRFFDLDELRGLWVYPRCGIES